MAAASIHAEPLAAPGEPDKTALELLQAIDRHFLTLQKQVQNFHTALFRTAPFNLSQRDSLISSLNALLVGTQSELSKFPIPASSSWAAVPNGQAVKCGRHLQQFRQAFASSVCFFDVSVLHNLSQCVHVIDNYTSKKLPVRAFELAMNRLRALSGPSARMCLKPVEILLDVYVQLGLTRAREGLISIYTSSSAKSSQSPPVDLDSRLITSATAVLEALSQLKSPVNGLINFIFDIMSFFATELTMGRVEGAVADSLQELVQKMVTVANGKDWFTREQHENMCLWIKPDSQQGTNHFGADSIQDVVESISKELPEFLKQVSPLPLLVQQRIALTQRIQTLVQRQLRHAELRWFGSSASGFARPDSDLDLCLYIPGLPDADQIQVLKTVKKCLYSGRFANILGIFHARVPIVKFSDPSTGINGDICVNNILALQNTSLLSSYVQLDYRVLPLGLIVKTWASRRGISDSSKGTFSSYAYILMVIHFLQTRTPPVLPCLQTNLEGVAKVTLEGWDATFQSDLSLFENFGQSNKQSTAALLLEFFDFMCFEFDWKEDVISIRTAACEKKKELQRRDSFTSRPLFIAIQDPFVLTHNLARVVTEANMKKIFFEFRRARDLLLRTGRLKCLVDDSMDGLLSTPLHAHAPLHTQTQNTRQEEEQHETDEDVPSDSDSFEMA
eukprot:GILK01011476.1.p1 GENE.GILK01011476.1~~GILK01011476.1.p1  ORF type:complete len:780 (+),score=142.43 GILK01011476.1:320-2341(+)